MPTPREALAKVLATGGLTGSVALLASSNGFLQLALVLSAPISSRLYSPEDYGALAVFGAALAVFSYVVCGRYDLAVPMAEDDRTAVFLLLLGVFVTLGVSAASGVVLCLWGAGILHLLSAEALKPYLWLFPLGLIALGVYHPLSYWSVRTKSYDALAKTRILQGVSSVALNLGVGAVYEGPLGLLLSNVALSSSGIGTLWRVARDAVRRHLGQASASALWRVAKDYRQFPLLSAPAGMINTLALMLCPFLLSAFYGPKVAGWFALAQRTMNMPTGLIGGAVYQVWLGEAADTVRTAPQHLAKRFDRISFRLTLLALLVLAAGLTAPFVFGFIFGAAWQRAGLFAALVTPFYASQLVVIPVSTTAVIARRQDLQFGIDVARCVLVALSLALPYRMGMGPEWAVGTYGSSMLVMNLATFALYRSLVATRVSRTPDPDREITNTTATVSDGANPTR